MTALPSSTTATANTATEGDVKNFLTNLRAYLSGLFGDTGVAADARTALGIVSAPSIGAALFTSSGTFTVPAGVTSALATCVGGGGQGGLDSSKEDGGYGGPGGGATAIVTGLTPGARITVTVGVGGGGSTRDGNNGGTTSFGSYLTVTGGTGGKSASNGGADGVRGSATVGTGATLVDGLHVPFLTYRRGDTTSALAYSINGAFPAGAGGGSGSSLGGDGGVGGKVLIEW